MEKQTQKYYYGLIIITISFLVVIFVLQNSITSLEKKLQNDIREYSSLFNENNRLQAELSYSLRLENFNIFTKDKIQEYKTLLPIDTISVKDLQDVEQ